MNVCDYWIRMRPRCQRFPQAIFGHVETWYDIPSRLPFASSPPYPPFCSNKKWEKIKKKKQTTKWQTMDKAAWYHHTWGCNLVVFDWLLWLYLFKSNFIQRLFAVNEKTNRWLKLFCWGDRHAKTLCWIWVNASHYSYAHIRGFSVAFHNLLFLFIATMPKQVTKYKWNLDGSWNEWTRIDFLCEEIEKPSRIQWRDKSKYTLIDEHVQ